MRVRCKLSPLHKRRGRKRKWPAHVKVAHQATCASPRQMTQEMKRFGADDAGFNLVSGRIMTPHGLIDGTVAVEADRIVFVRTGRQDRGRIARRSGAGAADRDAEPCGGRLAARAARALGCAPQRHRSVRVDHRPMAQGGADMAYASVIGNDQIGQQTYRNSPAIR